MAPVNCLLKISRKQGMQNLQSKDRQPEKYGQIEDSLLAVERKSSKGSC